MRKTLILLISVLLTGCVNDSASYFIDGRDSSLSVRRQQDYFWQDANVVLIASRLPDCQRRHDLASAAADDVKVEVFAAGDNLWNVRLGDQLWQIETTTCNGLVELQNDPKADLGQLVGDFEVQDGKLVFLPNPKAPAPAAATTATEAAQ